MKEELNGIFAMKRDELSLSGLSVSFHLCIFVFIIVDSVQRNCYGIVAAYPHTCFVFSGCVDDSAATST